MLFTEYEIRKKHSFKTYILQNRNLKKGILHKLQNSHTFKNMHVNKFVF